MKTIKLIIIITFVSLNVFSQNIINTLGTNGLFTIKNGTTNYLSLSQTTGNLSLNNNLVLPVSASSFAGVIYKGVERFLHNFGTNNTFLGIKSGNFTLSGTNNTAIGIEALSLNSTGYSNTTVGSFSLSSNTTGFNNNALGYLALYSNTSGSSNTAIGSESMISNTIGLGNTALGNTSLFSNSTGNNNTALGYQSLFSNTVGYFNTASGWRSMYSNTTGFDNTALGIQTLFSNSGGIFNSAIGNNSLYTNTTGNDNIALGYISLYSNTTGSQNIAIGSASLFNNTTGGNNIAIGYNTQVPSGILSNQVRIGNDFVTYAGVQVPWTITSDRRWKHNILSSGLGLNFISKLNPVSYKRINDETQRTEYGFIAQEVEDVLKESGIDNSGMITIDDNGMYELRYNDLLAPMVKAIQDLKSEKDIEIAQLKTYNNDLKKEIETMKTINEKVAKLEQLVNELTAIKNSSLTESK